MRFRPAALLAAAVFLIIFSPAGYLYRFITVGVLFSWYFYHFSVLAYFRRKSGFHLKSLSVSHYCEKVCFWSIPLVSFLLPPCSPLPPPFSLSFLLIFSLCLCLSLFLFFSFHCMFYLCRSPCVRILLAHLPYTASLIRSPNPTHLGSLDL